MSSLSIIEGPHILLAKMPTSYKFRASEVFEYFANVAKVNIAFQNATSPVDGEILVLKLGANTLTFTFETGYVGSAWNKIKPKADFTLLDDWLTYFVNALQRVPYIDRYYKVSASGTYIGTGTSIYCIIEAREAGDFDILIDPSTTMSYETGDTTFIHETNDLGYRRSLCMVTNLDMIKDRHHHQEQTFVSDIISYTTPDKITNTGVFSLNDLPRIIADNLGYDIPLQYEEAFLYRKNHLYFTFKNYLSNKSTLGVDERATDMLEYETSAIEKEVLAINGALPMKDATYEKHFEYVDSPSAQYSWIYSDYPDKRKFLTFQDRTKIIDKRQPDWLSFIIEKDDLDPLALTIKCTNASNVEAFGSVTLRESDVKKGIICIPTGYYQLDIPSIQADAIKYEVYIEDVSESFKYIIDQSTYKYSKYFIYQNAFSCIECIRFTGVSEFSLKKDLYEYKSSTERTTNINKGSFEMLQTEMTEQITVRSGFIEDKITLEQYKEIIHSPYIAELIDPKYSSIDTLEDIPDEVPALSRLRKMILISDSIDFLKDNDYTYGLEFKLKPANSEIAWSNIAHRYEPFFDSEIELDVFISTSANTLQWTSSISTHMRVYINNKYIDDVAYTFDTIGKHTIKIKAYNLIKLILNGTGYSIRFLKLESFSIKHIQLYDFAVMFDRYLTSRVLHLQNLLRIEIDGDGYIYGDDILLNLQILSDKFELLEYIKITGMPASAVKTNVSNYLTSKGLTVIL